MRKVILLATVMGVSSIAPMAAHAAEETTVRIDATIPLDKGKPTFSGGATHSQTRGNTTTTVGASTDGKNLNVSGSRTETRR
jgi:hypothetical protein